MYGLYHLKQVSHDYSVQVAFHFLAALSAREELLLDTHSSLCWLIAFEVIWEPKHTFTFKEKKKPTCVLLLSGRNWYWTLWSVKAEVWGNAAASPPLEASVSEGFDTMSNLGQIGKDCEFKIPPMIARGWTLSGIFASFFYLKCYFQKNTLQNNKKSVAIVLYLVQNVYKCDKKESH